jgi:hypothetical protein
MGRGFEWGTHMKPDTDTRKEETKEGSLLHRKRAANI